MVKKKGTKLCCGSTWVNDFGMSFEDPNWFEKHKEH